MALIDILVPAAETLGYNLQDSREKELLIRKVNRAAKEIYEGEDLKGSLRTEVFAVGAEQQQLTLPWYVAQVRGVRNTNTRLKMFLKDPIPLFHEEQWFQDICTWHVLRESPIERSFENASSLKVKLLGVEDDTLEVTITGATTTARRARGHLVFTPGTTELTTTQQFHPSIPGIESIVKNKTSQHDIEVFDASDNRIAELANVMTRSVYVIVQVTDQDRSPKHSDTGCYEILYKVRFVPMEDDHDEFSAFATYDDAIYWKTLEHYYASKEDANLDDVRKASEKSRRIIDNRNKDFARGLDNELAFGSSRLFGATERPILGGVPHGRRSLGNRH